MRKQLDSDVKTVDSDQIARHAAHYRRDVLDNPLIEHRDEWGLPLQKPKWEKVGRVLPSYLSIKILPHLSC